MKKTYKPAQKTEEPPKVEPPGMLIPEKRPDKLRTDLAIGIITMSICVVLLYLLNAVRHGVIANLRVEDDDKLARAVARGLRREGYAVDVAADGEAALVQVAVWEYDAIVLDIMLPRRDGIAVCEAVRERGCWAPVLMVTARGEIPDRVRGLDAGADDYLPKPFDFSELVARVQALGSLRPQLLATSPRRLLHRRDKSDV